MGGRPLTNSSVRSTMPLYDTTIRLRSEDATTYWHANISTSRGKIVTTLNDRSVTGHVNKTGLRRSRSAEMYTARLIAEYCSRSGLEVQQLSPAVDLRLSRRLIGAKSVLSSKDGPTVGRTGPTSADRPCPAVDSSCRRLAAAVRSVRFAGKRPGRPVRR